MERHEHLLDTIQKNVEIVFKQSMHFAQNGGDLQYQIVLEGNAHCDIAEALKLEGFQVTCLDFDKQLYRIEWR